VGVPAGAATVVVVSGARVRFFDDEHPPTTNTTTDNITITRRTTRSVCLDVTSLAYHRQSGHDERVVVVLRTLFLVAIIGALLLPIGVAIGRSWLLSIPPVLAFAYIGYLLLRSPETITSITLVALVLFVVVADTWLLAGIALRHRMARP
jgi:hypothetical protein